MSLRRKIARLFTLKTRVEVFCALYAITLGAVYRGKEYLHIFPGAFGWLMLLVCTLITFIVGAKLLDGLRLEKAHQALLASRPPGLTRHRPRHVRPHPGVTSGHRVRHQRHGRRL